MMDMKLVGNRIRERREEIGMSSQELADKLDMNKATIYRYEQGFFKSAKIPVIENIAKILSVNPSWLIGKSNDKFTIENLLSNNDDSQDKDIEKIIHTTTDLLMQEGLMFGGNPIDKESIQSIIDAMEIGMEMAKKKAQRKKG